MARTVNEAGYAAKRDDILDAAQRLIAAKGFEEMTIQGLLDDLGVSKGALYHYFDSKQAILDGLTDRILQQVELLLIPVVHDTSVGAIDKLQQFFAALVQWKTGHKPFSLALMRMWYTDENAVLRQKLRETRIKRFGQLLETILRQGREQGTMSVDYPDQSGRVILAVVEDLSDTLARLLLSDQVNPENATYVDHAVAASTEAVERIVGLPQHSLSLVGAEALREWMGPTLARPRRAGRSRSATVRHGKGEM
ncbi:MAG TPA: TetR/AcrR family transcriptional regulator [Mycobacterium sp.]|nr:TetR/AcrR family transcriptional regulator [Mycobacterium sp.]HUH69569.1 TetR/AcrR family transcriptional regulator [Mycobacterium sp.]